MGQLPEDRTTRDTAQEHVDDHNELHRLHNVLEGENIPSRVTALEEGSPGASGVAWEAVTVPTAAASWDVAGATGTWDFSTPGEIAQTDETQTGAVIFTKTPQEDQHGSSWAVECDMRLDDDGGNTPAATFAAGIATFSGGRYALAGVGIHNGQADGVLDANQGGSDTMTPLVDEWHTYRIIVVGDTGFMYYDGELFAWGFIAAANAWAAVVSSQFGFVNVAGAFTFRNLKAWRIPVPTLT